jgi:putative oxidoreductase
MRSKLLAHREALSLLILRLGLSLIFVAHGYLKLFYPRFGPQGFAAYLESIHVPMPLVVAYAIGVLEFVGGVLLVTGLLARWAAGALAIHVTLAIVFTGAERGFTRLPEGVGVEFEVVLLAALFVVLLCGGGAWSLEAQRTKQQ